MVGRLKPYLNSAKLKHRSPLVLVSPKLKHQLHLGQLKQTTSRSTLYFVPFTLYKTNNKQHITYNSFSMRYKLFGHSGLRVSEICLGTMTFGTEWTWGADYDESKLIFDAFANAGGTFIDTANRYTEGSSERFVGDFIHADRDHFVLATKYSLQDRKGDLNYSGNHRKNLMRSVESSLKRLNTEFIDILWLHAWDFTTPEAEVMRALDDLVRSGKVNYIGVSDTPAWIVAQSNMLAELRAWTRFVGLQVEYSLLQRTPERDLLPMAKHWDMAITPWAPLAGGALTGKYLKNTDEQKRLAGNSKRLLDRNAEIAAFVVAIAEKMGVSPAQVALNWVRQKGELMIPVVGARKLAQIEDSLGCLAFNLSVETMQELDTLSAVEMGFPHDFLASDGVKEVLFGGAYKSLDNHRDSK
jgi:aryl-alcohol dehydrogenase-like predicted oxidoreductase